MLLLKLYMVITARMSGGGLYANRLPHGLNRLPELLFALPFGYVAFLSTGNLLLGALGWLWSFVAMELGHGNFYRMTGVGGGFTDRPQSIERLTRPIFSRLGGDITHPSYSWVNMGLKGLLIGLPAAPAGLLLVVLWPLSYHVGTRIEKAPALSEYLSGVAAALVLGATIWA